MQTLKNKHTKKLNALIHNQANKFLLKINKYFYSCHQITIRAINFKVESHPGLVKIIDKFRSACRNIKSTAKVDREDSKICFLDQRFSFLNLKEIF